MNTDQKLNPDLLGLLASCRAAPADDTPRLVLADYCDERDDPLGEFIRLQMTLEPLYLPCADPAAELERRKRWAGIPPGGDHPDDTWEGKQRLDRQAELLRAHQAEWLGDVGARVNDTANRFRAEFRRGFVASAEVGLTAFREHGAALRRACPTLQQLVVLGTLGRGKELASCAALAGLTGLTLVGGLNRKDAAALFRSRHLWGLRSLTVWIGHARDEEIYRTLARLSGLTDLTLVQAWGGLGDDDPDGRDRRTDDLADMVRRLRPDCRVCVERPFARRFPLDGVHVGRGYDAGHVFGGAVLIRESRWPYVMHFDAEGRFQREARLDLSDKLSIGAEYDQEAWDHNQLIEMLGREIGFVPGPIFVREFQATQALVTLYSFAFDEHEVPTTDPQVGEDFAANAYYWRKAGWFVLGDDRNTCWIEGTGRRHTF